MPLVLGGVAIDHPPGLAGHSDGDVIAHALIDALLGAADRGDIGSLFPSGDERYRGASLARPAPDAYARRPRRRLAARQRRLRPRRRARRESAPHRDEMCRLLAAAMGVDAERVAVRATTTDHLGFTGREEGLAAHAVALLER